MARAAARSWLIATLLLGLVSTNAGAVAVRVVAVVLDVAVALGVERAVVVDVVVGLAGVALVVECVVDERELVADATVVVLELVANAELDLVVVTEAGAPEPPHAAMTAASARPSPSATAVGRILIGRV